MSSAGSNPTDVADAWRLDGRIVMVSGAGGGIGRSVVRILHEAGAVVSVCDLSEVAPPGDGTSASGDLSRPEVARAWAEATVARSGRIDALVNVAGLWRSKPFVDTSSDDLAAGLAANFTSTWNTCHAVAPTMLDQGSGSIVNFASTAGQFGSIRPGAAYAAAKGAVIALTKTLARELSPSGVRVNAVSPGPVDTSAAGSGVDLDDEEVRNRTLLRRSGRPDEIAHAVLYLVSDASSFTTGAVLNANGGSLL